VVPGSSPGGTTIITSPFGGVFLCLNLGEKPVPSEVFAESREAQVGPLLMLVKPFKQYVCGAFFIIRGRMRGGINHSIFN